MVDKAVKIGYFLPYSQQTTQSASQRSYNPQTRPCSLKTIQSADIYILHTIHHVDHITRRIYCQCADNPVCQQLLAGYWSWMSFPTPPEKPALVSCLKTFLIFGSFMFELSPKSFRFMFKHLLTFKLLGLNRTTESTSIIQKYWFPGCNLKKIHKEHSLWYEETYLTLLSINNSLELPLHTNMLIIVHQSKTIQKMHRHME